MPESAALARFRLTMDMAAALLRVESAFPDTPSSQDEAILRGLRGGAAVLMVAAFESYLRNGLKELLQPLISPAKPFQSLPEKLQVASVFSSLELAMKGPRHGKPGKRACRLPGVQVAAARIANGLLDAEALSQTRSNPNSDTVSQLLGNLGIRHPFTHIRATFDIKWGKPEAATFVEDKLDEIVQRRHRVAHSADALSISRTDLSEGLHFLRVLAEVIDSDVQTHIGRL